MNLFIDDNPIRGMRMLEVVPGILVSDNESDAIELLLREKTWDTVYFEYHLEDTSPQKAPADELIKTIIEKVQEGELAINEVITHTLDRLEAYQTIVKFNKVGIPCKWIRFPDLLEQISNENN